MNKILFIIIFIIILMFTFIFVQNISKKSFNTANLDFFDNKDTKEEDLKNNYKYTAIIIEPRKHKALEFVLQNFNDNLSDEWQFIVFHGNKNKEYTEKICKKVFIPERVKILDLKVDNLDSYTYSGILLDKLFYDNIKTEIFLIFQTDSIICGKYKKTINDFLKYDYVGAPYASGNVGNGGLSLRKKSKMLEILNKCKIKNDKDVYLMEDRFFSYGCDGIDINLPSIKEANNFSIESTMSNKSFGIHKAYKYLDNNAINAINEWCPEINTLAKLNN